MSKQAGEGTGALEKALDVLDLVGMSPEGVSQTVIAERLDLPRTTAYRLLATLVGRGLLRRDPLRKVYCLGFRCLEMARQAYAMPDLVASAALELRSLRDLTGETTYLATLDGREVISLERCDGAHSERSAAVLGQRKPLHCTSQGKAMLSAMPDAARDALVAELMLKPLTPLTITDRRRLQAELRITKARGYAIDDEEIVLGVRCVGAPIVDTAGEVRGAISVAGPAYRLTRERLELLGPELAEAARRVGEQLEPQAVEERQAHEAAVWAMPGPWAFHGAHPVWCARRQRLYWADRLAPSVRVWDGEQDRQLARVEAPVVGLYLQGDGVVAVHERGAFSISAEGVCEAHGPWPGGTVLAVCQADGADGDVWAAMALPESGSAIGRIRVDGSFEVAWRMGEPVGGLCWSRLEQALYASAPGSGAILQLTVGQPLVRRLATVPRGAGHLGGLTVDAQGGIWAALKDGWALMRFTPTGSLDRVIGLPVPCATDVAFGGPALDCLYITTSRHSVSLDTLGSAPLSGRLLACRP